MTLLSEMHCTLSHPDTRFTHIDPEEESLSTKLQDGVQRSQRWMDFLQRYRENIRDAMSLPAQLQAIESMPDDWTDEQILDTFRQFAGEYAGALEAWADIREAAAEVTDRLLAEGRLRP